jgi:hypothetical protein
MKTKAPTERRMPQHGYKNHEVDFMAANEEMGFEDGESMEDTEEDLWPDPLSSEPLFEDPEESPKPQKVPGQKTPPTNVGLGNAPTNQANQRKFPGFDLLRPPAGGFPWPEMNLMGLTTTPTPPIAKQSLEKPRTAKVTPKEVKTANNKPLDPMGMSFGGFPDDFTAFKESLSSSTTPSMPAREERKLTPLGMSGYYVEDGVKEIIVPEDSLTGVLPASEAADHKMGHSHTYTHSHQHAHKSDHTHGHQHAHEHKASHAHEHKHGHTHAADHKHAHSHGHKHGHDHQHGHAHKSDHKHAHSHAADHKHAHTHDHKAGHKHLHQHQHENKHAHAHTGEHKHHHHHEHHHHHHHKHTHAAEHKHGHTHQHDHKGHY